MTVLEVSDLSVRHGGVLALDEVSLQVPEGEVVGLIGPNGAGKTTFIDTVCGFTSPSGGRINFCAAPIERLAPHDRSRLGLVRTFQSLELFDDLTVRENVFVAAATPDLRSTVTDVFWPKRHQSDAADEALAAMDLLPLADRFPTALSNGERHRVALARALVAQPRLLLLDEPGAGLDPAETAELASSLRRLPQLGTSVLLVDHDMSLVLNVCDTIHVLDLGRRIATGTPAEVRADPVVIAAYLGAPTAAGADVAEAVHAAEAPEDHSVEPGAAPAGGPLDGATGRAAPDDSSRRQNEEAGEAPGPDGVRAPAPHTESLGDRSAAATADPRALTASASDDLVLRLEGLVAGYEGVPVVHDLDLTLAAGEVVALLGANGAGKTTTLLTISGLLPRMGGRLEVLGSAVEGRKRMRGADVWGRARLGVAHVPEDRGIFFDLTAREHLRLARARRNDNLPLEQVLAWFPALEPILDRRAGLMSGGEQQMLALARAVLGRPRLLLVDELSLGLAPIIVERILPVLRSIADETGAGILLVEQHVGLALGVADSALILGQGRVVASGAAAALAADPALIEAGYFGA